MHIVSTNFDKTLVGKHEYDVTHSAHQIQITTIRHGTKTPSWKFSASTAWREWVGSKEQLTRGADIDSPPVQHSLRK